MVRRRRPGCFPPRILGVRRAESGEAGRLDSVRRNDGGRGTRLRRRLVRTAHRFSRPRPGGHGRRGAAAWAVGKPLSPIGAAARTAPEVEKAGRQGYDICFRLESRAKRFVRYAFVARRLGRVVGRLDADFIGAEQRLYTQNVFVAKAHRKRGLAAALLISAAKTTGCVVVATSGRTADGTAYFAGMRPLLKRHGVELRDGPCVVCSPKVVQAP